MDEDLCSADFIDATVDCDLPAGHEGDHQALFTWPQSDPLPLIAGGGAVMAGYAAYMLHRYGEWVSSGMPAVMSSPQTTELVRRGRWWRRA